MEEVAGSRWLIQEKGGYFTVLWHDSEKESTQITLCCLVPKTGKDTRRKN